MSRFLTLVNGVKHWITALAVSTGVADANKIVMTSSTGRIDGSLMPVGIGAETQVMVASEALIAGDFVNIFNNGGVPNARKADNSNGRSANGFVLESVANAANATIYLSGLNNARTGMIPGTVYFLGTSGGVSTSPPPSTSIGAIIQQLGVSANTTTIQFDYDAPITIGA